MHTSYSVPIEQAAFRRNTHTRIYIYICIYNIDVMTTNEEKSYGFERVRKGVWEGWREERKYRVTRDVKICRGAINAYE